MNANMKTTGVIIALMMVAASAYWLGARQGSQPAPSVKSLANAAPLPGTPEPSVVAADHPTVQPQPGVSLEIDNLRFAHFKVGNSNVKALLADGPLLWVGTSGGVIRYDMGKDEHHLYDVRAGLLSNGIFHLSKYGERLLIGTYGGGLSLFDPAAETWANYNIQHGLADAFVYDVLQLDNGDMWIATWSGANFVQGGRLDDRDAWSTYTVENTGGGLPNDWVYALAKGKEGSIWMATEGGLAQFDNGEWRHWKHQDGLGAPYEVVREQIRFQRDPAKESSHHARQKAEMGLQGVDVAYNPNYIVSLYVDVHGVVWCGTWGGGLSRLEGNNWKTYTVADGLPSNHIFMLEAAKDGGLWIGTSDGLARFDGESFSLLTTHQGLFANNVFSLARGESNELWVGSFGGVAKLEGIN